MRWFWNARETLISHLGYFWLGFLDSLVSCAAIAVSLLAAAWGFSVADPSAELLWRLAEIDAALFIAYSVAAVGTGPRFDDGIRRNWLGAICGLGVCVLSGVFVSLALAAYREAGHSGVIDRAGACWSTATMLLVGGFIAFLPAVVSSWRVGED